MKKVLLLAALVLAAAFVKAQNPNRDNPSPVPADSVSVMLRQLAATNAEVQYLNDCIRLHSQLALGSFVIEAAGGACLYLASKNSETNLRNLGLGLCIAGGVGFLASYIPIWTKNIRLDERGLVISLGKEQKHGY